MKLEVTRMRACSCVIAIVYALHACKAQPRDEPITASPHTQPGQKQPSTSPAPRVEEDLATVLSGDMPDDFRISVAFHTFGGGYRSIGPDGWTLTTPRRERHGDEVGSAALEIWRQMPTKDVVARINGPAPCPDPSFEYRIHSEGWRSDLRIRARGREFVIELGWCEKDPLVPWLTRQRELLVGLAEKQQRELDAQKRRSKQRRKNIKVEY